MKSLKIPNNVLINVVWRDYTMREEELMFQAKDTQDVEKRKQLMGDAYFANYGLTVSLLKDLGANERNFDDFIQLSYIAFDKAVRSYERGSQHTILSYYRMCLKHECYKHWLEERRGGNYSEVSGFNAVFEKSVDYKQVEVAYEVLELNEMNSLLWQRVDSVLDEHNAMIIRERFQKARTLKMIGEENGVTAESVRKRIIHACKELHSDCAVREVAQYYHYL